MRRRDLVCAIGLLSVARPAIAAAQEWRPTKPIRLIVGNPPGGSNDLLARLIQAPLSELLGQTIVVENRVGAGTVVSTQYIAHAPADGYTLATIISVHASNVSMQPDLPYDAVKDFTPIAFLGFIPNIVCVNPKLPVKTLVELVAYDKAHPGTIHHGSSGIGTSQHFSGELLNLRAGTDFIHVPYRGGGPAINDLVSGQIEMMFGNFSSILPYVQSGQVRPLALTGAHRSPLFPDLPTVAEALNLPGFDVSEWYAVVGPAKLPTPIVDRVNTAIYTVLRQPDLAAKLKDWGVETDFMTPAALGDFIKSEIAKFHGIVEQAHIKIIK
jgi:tripartite-type tricarboxylate transporter receptor subunit TctC